MHKNLKKYFHFVAVLVTAVVFAASASSQGSSKLDDKMGSTDQMLSTTIVISQTYSGGGGTTGTYLNDYIELKNISSSPQSLNGLFVVYGSATGQFASVATNSFALPNVSLNPGQYFLVQTSPAGTGGVAFPVAPDATTTNLAMAGASGKVALVTSAFTNNTCGATATPCTLPNAAIIDLVSYGVSNNAEGGVTVNNGVALTTVQGSVRKTGGCTETDNNNNDFDVVSPPVPRNTGSTAAPCSAAPTQNIVDFDGNGRTDFAVVRNTGGGSGGQITWFINANGPGTTAAYAWGLSTDFFVPVDYDGDNKTDIAVWRPAAATVAAFYILQSGTNTARVETFGQTGDDPTVVDDYNGDGKADLAVYRAGASAGQQSTWFYRATPGGPTTYVPWGLNGDFPAPGDYDGDGKGDFVMQRNNGGGQARYWRLFATGATDTVVFGTPTDVIVPGDYDGDGKTDIAVIRGSAGQINWYVRPSSTGAENGAPTIFGASATDLPTQGDYDGDGKTDIAIWRPSATPGASAFWFLGSTSGAGAVPFGASGDFSVASYNRH